MRPQERLQYIEELLLNPYSQLKRMDAKDYFDVYGCSERTFERSLTEYNRKLNEAYNLNYNPGDEASEIKYVECVNKVYRLKKDSQGNPYTLFNKLGSLKESDWKRLADVIEFNADLFDDSFINKFRGFKAFWNAQEKQVPWKPVQLVKDGKRSGKVNIEIIAKAITQKRFIEVNHQSFFSQNRIKTLKLLPLILREYSNGWISGWYLLAYKIPEEGISKWPQFNDLNIFALDRLKNVNLLNQTLELEIPENYHPEDYFKYTLGIHRVNRIKSDLAPERIVIKTIFRQSEADPMWIYPYLLHYPIHTTQKLVHDDPQSQQLTIELQMEVDVELKAFLMRYSNELEVLEPISLRKEIIGRLSQALAHYSK
jgi:hypothetical protein